MWWYQPKDQELENNMYHSFKQISSESIRVQFYTLPNQLAQQCNTPLVLIVSLFSAVYIPQELVIRHIIIDLLYLQLLEL